MGSDVRLLCRLFFVTTVCRLVVFAAIALLVGGCTTFVLPVVPSPQPSGSASSAASSGATTGGLRDATTDERSDLARLGMLALGEPAYAFDLPAGRSLVGAVLTYEGAPARRHPGMVVADGSRFALVTCEWDGRGALGVDVGTQGQQGITALRGVLGDELCDPWIVAPTADR
jgi:hypothetical protein